MKSVAIAGLAILALACAAAWFIWPTGDGMMAGLSGRGVLVVQLNKGRPETLCSADGATVKSWPSPAADMSVELTVPPGGYNAILGDGPCNTPDGQGGNRAEVRRGQVTRYQFVAISANPGR